MLKMALSFNRYMVECKYRTSPCNQKYNPVLIDTWWNVNLGRVHSQKGDFTF